MTTALYRRYRPQVFAEVIGQEHVTEPLSTELRANRVNHAYLFSGPRGCGKTTSARILARCLNCEQGPTPIPCGTCPSCVELARGGPGSLDVVEIDAASHGGVDDARDLRERAAFAPVRDRFKVFIIDEAHMVSTQGFNALLKIVEEPPEHIRFIFATTEPEKVIGTIRSRTHHYPFRLVPPERLQSYLAQLCEQEGVAVGKGVLPLVVRAGAGSVRDSLSVLDQLIAGAGEEGLTYPTAVSLLGYTDGALLDDVVDALAAADGATVFAVVDRVIESGHDPRRFVEDLLERLRDLLVVAAVRDGAHAVFRGVPDDQLDRMRGQAARFGAAELSRAADVTNAALTEMTGATSPRLQLELLCARLLLPGAEDTERGLRARLDRLEKRVGVAVPGQVAQAPPQAAPQAAQPQAPLAPAAAQESAPALSADEWAPPAAAAEPAASAEPAAPAAPAERGTPGSADVEAIRRMWPDVLAKLSGIKRATWSLVSQHAQVLDYDGQRLLLGFGSQGLAGSFGRGAHQEFLRQALIDVMGLDCTVEATAGDPRSASARSQSAGAPPRPTASVSTPAPAAPAAPAPAAPAPAAPERAPEPAPRPAPSRRPERARAESARGATPYDEVPPPPLDEPPPREDELPPDDGWSGRTRRAPAAASGPAPRATRPVPAQPADPPLQAAAPRRISLDDDVPSADDPDIEGSHLVGARVVEQLLGGRVIEEREE